MKGSEFVFGYVETLFYKCYQVSLNGSGSCIDFSQWLKNKKITINLKNKTGKGLKQTTKPLHSDFSKQQ